MPVIMNIQYTHMIWIGQAAKLQNGGDLLENGLKSREMRALSLMYGQITTAKEVDGEEMEIEPQASCSKAV